MKVNWQAYLDQSLSEAEMRVAEHELANNPSARQELNGLKNFLVTVRNVGQAEEVPLERLSRLLPVQPTKKSWIPRIAWSAGLVATIIAGVWFLQPQPTRVEIYTSNPFEATQWAKQRLGMDIPVMDLGSDAQLFLVHEGKQRCCFDYRVHGDTYHVNVRADDRGIRLEGTPVTLQTGTPAAIDRGVRWRERKFEFFIVGPQKNISLDLANRTSKLLTQRI